MRLLPLVPLLALAACETPRPAPPAGAALTLRQVAAETRGRPYECTRYQAASDSCEAIARWTISGNEVQAETLFALDAGLPATVRVISRHRIDSEGRSCGLVGASRVTVLSEGSARAEEAIAGLFSALQTGSMQNACATYRRDGAGYITTVTDAQGHLIEDSAAQSRFFERPRKLRPVQMQAL